MTHSPQRNEVEDRGADTYLSICFLYLPYCRGVETRIPKRAVTDALRRFHTHHSAVAAARAETGLRTRIERFIGYSYCYYLQ